MTTTALRAKLDALGHLPIDLHDRDFLLTWEQDEPTLRFVLLAAEILEDLVAAGISTFWLADSLYLVRTAQGVYESGGWFDAGWWAVAARRR